MAYSVDPATGHLVISGFQNGVGTDPYSGLTDVRNLNVTSVPNEASVAFATAKISTTSLASTITSANSGTGFLTASSTTGLENNSAIVFSVSSGGGISINTVYWVTALSGNTFQLYVNWPRTPTTVTITGTLTGTFSTVNVNFGTNSNNAAAYQGNQPNKFCTSARTGFSYLVDSFGNVWSNAIVTSTTNSWTYTGNNGHQSLSSPDAQNGNGIVYYQPSNAGASGTATKPGYIFVWADSSIDYLKEDYSSSAAWAYGWDPGSASNNNSPGYLNSAKNSGNSHDALVGQDNVVYYCDGNQVNSFFENTNQTFAPLTGSTYTTSSSSSPALTLPIVETSTCLAELGVNLLVGGQRNLVYPWDRTSTSFTYPIWLSENSVQKMITVKANTYIFVGNRGNIHITNGSQADIWAKVPDHVSGTVEPYYIWGGACANKNQLFFSIKATNNMGTTLTTYGGVWAIDITSRTLRLLNTLSYNTNAGYVLALMPEVPIFNGGELVGNPNGYGFFAGWDSGATTYGIDGTVSTPYTGGQAIVVSDLIPIGTALDPTTASQIEIKLNEPLKTGESIQILMGSSFADYANNTFTSVGTLNGDGATLSANYPITVQRQQWLIIKSILTSISSSPSYVRLTQIRVIGATVKSGVSTAPFSVA